MMANIETRACPREKKRLFARVCCFAQLMVPKVDLELVRAETRVTSFARALMLCGHMVRFSCMHACMHANTWIVNTQCTLQPWLEQHHALCGSWLSDPLHIPDPLLIVTINHLHTRYC